VLDGVSLSAEGGEFIALLGSSGCGKTTLLRAICGFVTVASGAISVGARDITRLPPDKRNIAMVFQSYALWPHMTVAQNMAYGLKLRRAGRTEIAARIADLLTMLRLEGLGERKVTALSGGQRQRVALGRALAINPQILLLDEPLSNLDARIREEVRHEIKTLQQDLGITTVHVTHDRQEAMVMADRIAILDAGHVAQIGTPEEIYNRPISPFVAGFMGATNAPKGRSSSPKVRSIVASPSSSRASSPTVLGRCPLPPRQWLTFAANRRGFAHPTNHSTAAWCCADGSPKPLIPAAFTAMRSASDLTNIWWTTSVGWRSVTRSVSPCRQRRCISIRFNTRSKSTGGSHATNQHRLCRTGSAYF
jgi:ABC-type sulfate/molybdate transport systems ATPase subunit